MTTIEEDVPKEKVEAPPKSSFAARKSPRREAPKPKLNHSVRSSMHEEDFSKLESIQTPSDTTFKKPRISTAIPQSATTRTSQQSPTKLRSSKSTMLATNGDVDKKKPDANLYMMGPSKATVEELQLEI